MFIAIKDDVKKKTMPNVNGSPVPVSSAHGPSLTGAKQVYDKLHISPLSFCKPSLDDQISSMCSSRF